MTITFLKKLGKNLFTILAMCGLIYSFLVVSDKYFGEALYGLIAFVVLFTAYWITERSWDDAKREYEEVRYVNYLGGKGKKNDDSV
jgi:hypothetical protein